VWLLVVVGCVAIPEQVSVRGLVTTGEDGLEPLSDATVFTLDDEGYLFDSTESSASGAFMLDAPYSEVVFVQVAGVGQVTSSFTGTSGSSPALFVDKGDVHGFSAERALEWRARFAGCPGSAEGPFTVGTLELLGAVDEQGLPVRVETGYVTMRDDDGFELTACYLTADGAAWDPYALETGPSGTWAVFGLHEGLWELVAGYTSLGEPVYEITWRVWVPNDGVVPRFPLSLELAL
jgi:hypothetical protein